MEFDRPKPGFFSNCVSFLNTARMRPTLFLLALTVSVGICTAQTNSVGYATVRIPSGFSLLANPLSAGVTNGANEMGLLIDGEVILTWNGIGFDSYAYDSGTRTWLDAASQPTSPPSLPPGRGFFFANPGAATNFTFSGRITPSPGSTNVITLLPGYSLVSSPLPASVTNITAAPVNLPRIDGMQILTWNGSNYVYSGYDTAFGGWVDADFRPQLPQAYNLGQGFFIFNPGPAVAWRQFLP